MKLHAIVRLFAYGVVFAAIMPLVADTENVDGIEWQYIIEANTVTIVGDAANWKPAIPKTTTGVLTVPSTLGGYPVRRIGDWAFGRCDGLTTVIIPEGIEHIGSSAFCDCSGLTGITFPDGVKSIGDLAFLRCTNLAFARIPASVTNVGYSAFSVCNKLKDVTIPSCVFARQSYPAGASSYLSTKNIFSSYSVITNVIICDGAKCIGDGDFQGWRNLRGVAIPDSVRDIGNYAFEGCSSLCNLQLPNVITNIGWKAFEDCQALTDLVLPENLTCVKSEAFRNCSGVTNVALNVGLEDIGESAFYGCSSLTRLEIPDSVTNIAKYAFAYCRGVTNVILGKNLGKVGSCAFYPIAAEIVFRGNAPQIDTSGGLAFDTSCVAHVLYGSTGWGVEIPGIWNGMRIEYMDDDVEMPVITPSDGTTFRNASCTVVIMCETPGASIYYTTDGGTPRPTSRYLYSGPFVIEDTAEICAVAVKDGKYSDYVTATITKGEVLTLPEALGAPAMAVTTGGDAEWRPVDDAVAIHGLSAMSGGIAPEEETWIEFEVFGAGTISFNWRADCEKDPRNRYSYDRGIFSIDGTAICKIDGLTDWMAVTNVISSGGVHVIRWTYIKDDYDEDDYTGEDCIWVNDVSWAPIELIPELLVDAAASTITNAIESVGFADTDGVKAAIGGSAAKYAAFKEWAQSVKVPVGSDGWGAIATQAGEATVVANTNAAVAFLLGAERLFENAPTIEMEGMTVVTSATLQGGGGQESVRPTEVTVSVAVKDGETAVVCDADKIKDMFEATTDLGDWNGTAKLKPTVTVVHGDNSAVEDGCSSMRFTVVPGDGTATRAFLRVKVK